MKFFNKSILAVFAALACAGQTNALLYEIVKYSKNTKEYNVIIYLLNDAQTHDAKLIGQFDQSNNDLVLNSGRPLILGSNQINNKKYKQEVVVEVMNTKKPFGPFRSCNEKFFYAEVKRLLINAITNATEDINIYSKENQKEPIAKTKTIIVCSGGHQADRLDDQLCNKLNMSKEIIFENKHIRDEKTHQFDEDKFNTAIQEKTLQEADLKTLIQDNKLEQDNLVYAYITLYQNTDSITKITKNESGGYIISTKNNNTPPITPLNDKKRQQQTPSNDPINNNTITKNTNPSTNNTSAKQSQTQNKQSSTTETPKNQDTTKNIQNRSAIFTTKRLLIGGVIATTTVVAVLYGPSLWKWVKNKLA